MRNLILAALAALGVLSAAAAQSGQPAAPAPVCVSQPITATHTIPPYPELSRKLSEQGRVVLTVTMSQRGVPTAVAVSTSSGAPRLDDAAVAWVKQTWRWLPLDAACIRGVRTMVAVDFKLVGDTTPIPVGLTITVADADFPDGAKAKNETGQATLLVLLDETGAVTGARLTHSTGFEDLDERALLLVRKHVFEAATVDGKPAASGMWIAVQFGAPPPPPG